MNKEWLTTARPILITSETVMLQKVYECYIWGIMCRAILSVYSNQKSNLLILLSSCIADR